MADIGEDVGAVEGTATGASILLILAAVGAVVYLIYSYTSSAVASCINLGLFTLGNCPPAANPAQATADAAAINASGGLSGVPAANTASGCNGCGDCNYVDDAGMIHDCSNNVDTIVGSTN